MKKLISRIMADFRADIWKNYCNMREEFSYTYFNQEEQNGLCDTIIEVISKDMLLLKEVHAQEKDINNKTIN